MAQQFYQGSDIPLILPLTYSDGTAIPSNDIAEITANVLMNGALVDTYKYTTADITRAPDGTYVLTIPRAATKAYDTGKLNTEILVRLNPSAHYSGGLYAVYENEITELLAAPTTKTL